MKITKEIAEIPGVVTHTHTHTHTRYLNNQIKNPKTTTQGSLINDELFKDSIYV